MSQTVKVQIRPSARKASGRRNGALRWDNLSWAGDNRTCLLGAELHIRTVGIKMKIFKTHILTCMYHQIRGELKLFYNKVQSEKFF